MVGLNEDTVREIVERAVDLARHSSPDNMSNEAIVQRALREKYIDGRWRSEYFLPLYISVDEL